MKISKKKIEMFFLYIVLFYIIYTPTLSSSIFLHKYVVIPVLSVFLIFLYPIRYDKFSFKMLFNKKVFFCLVCTIISIIYYLIIYMINNPDFDINSARILQGSMPVFYIIIISIILSRFKELNYSKKQIIQILIDLAVFQGIICVLMVVIPSLKNIAIYLYSLGQDTNVFVVRNRIYGISLDYTYATPIYHGFIASICFLLFLNGDKKKLISMILILVSVFLNGRTGIIVFIICSLIVMLHYLFNRKKLMKFFNSIILLCVLLVGAMFALKAYVPNTYQFVNGFVNDTIDLFVNHEYNGNYGALKKSLQVPKGIKLLFGEGHRIYGSEGKKYGYITSDIGYTNDLFMGGILYCILLYLPYIYLIHCSKTKSMKNDKIILFNLFILMLIANFKGEMFRSNILIFLLLYLTLANLFIKEETI